MKNEKLDSLCDLITKALASIQRDFKDINPLVGVNQKMREMGVPVDAVTIDCLKSGKRILLILHDQQHDILSYQFAFKNQDPGEKFEHIPFNEVTETLLSKWIKGYFQDDVANSGNG